MVGSWRPTSPTWRVRSLRQAAVLILAACFAVADLAAPAASAAAVPHPAAITAELETQLRATGSDGGWPLTGPAASTMSPFVPEATGAAEPRIAPVTTAAQTADAGALVFAEASKPFVWGRLFGSGTAIEIAVVDRAGQLRAIASLLSQLPAIEGRPVISDFEAVLVDPAMPTRRVPLQEGDSLRLRIVPADSAGSPSSSATPSGLIGSAAAPAPSRLELRPTTSLSEPGQNGIARLVPISAGLTRAELAVLPEPLGPLVLHSIAEPQAQGDAGPGAAANAEAAIDPLVPDTGQWLAPTLIATVFAGPDLAAPALRTLPDGAAVEQIGKAIGERVPVRFPGDGNEVLAGFGWIDRRLLAPIRPREPSELPTAYPHSARPDAIRLFAPYRTQLDGMPYADSNCGPASLSMALGALGIDADPGTLRAEVLDAQGIYGDDAGTLITALAEVAEDYGATPIGLYEGVAIRRWSLDDIRTELAQGRPVIVQVALRALPGHEQAEFGGDHYIVLTGAVDDLFIYHDPLDREGPGWDRLITAAHLHAAMNATDRAYAYAGFALTR